MTRKIRTKGKKPANLVQTIERTALILEILGDSPSGISLGELSEKVELPKGTTHRLITSLAYFDFVRQDSLTKNYQLGFKLVDLGNLLLSEIDLRSEARPYLIRLSESVKETIHLVVLDDDKALYATGVYGGDMLERFLAEFGFQVSLAHKRDDIRSPAQDVTTVWPMSEYSRTGAC